MLSQLFSSIIRTLAAEASGRGVRVNAIGRFGKVQDSGSAVFLSSRAAKFIAGAVLPVGVNIGF